MNRDELLEELESLARIEWDPEVQHAEAVRALLEFIDDDEITAAYGTVPRWDV